MQCCVSFLSAGLSSRVRSCSEQRVLLSIQRTLGICPGCGTWHLNSRSVASCKKAPQISWHLLLLIVRRKQPPKLATLSFKSLLCVTFCSVNRTSLTAWPAGCFVFSLLSPRHLLTKQGHIAQIASILKARDPHSIHKIKNLHLYWTSSGVVCLPMLSTLKSSY